MDSRAIVGSVRNRRSHPIVAGTVVGLITGVIGLFATLLISSTSAGGILGAVGCGVTVAYLSEGPLYKLVGHAIIADVLSSTAFFFLVLFAYLAMVWVTEGLAVVSAIWFSMMYLVFGGMMAVTVAVISLVITGFSATVTAFVIRSNGKQPAFE